MFLSATRVLCLPHRLLITDRNLVIGASAQLRRVPCACSGKPASGRGAVALSEISGPLLAGCPVRPRARQQCSPTNWYSCWCRYESSLAQERIAGVPAIASHQNQVVSAPPARPRASDQERTQQRPVGISLSPPRLLRSWRKQCPTDSSSARIAEAVPARPV